jgi:hypothetical protein
MYQVALRIYLLVVKDVQIVLLSPSRSSCLSVCHSNLLSLANLLIPHPPGNYKRRGRRTRRKIKRVIDRRTIRLKHSLQLLGSHYLSNRRSARNNNLLGVHSRRIRSKRRSESVTEDCLGACDEDGAAESLREHG